MAKFEYKAEYKGAIEKGMMEGADIASIVAQLRALGKVPILVEPYHRARKINDAIERFLTRVSLKEKIVFARTLAAMLKAGLSLSRALTILEKQTSNKKLQAVYHSLIQNVASGKSLSDSMEEFKKIFPPLFIAMVRAGEESGNLPNVLHEVSEHLEKIYTIRKKVIGALIYPAIVIVAVLLIGILMFIFVVPTLTATFADIGAELPLSTRIVIGISDVLRNHLLLLIIIVAFAAAGIWLFHRSPKGKRFFHLIVARMWIIGPLVRKANSAQVARTLSSLLSAGVRVSHALEITHDVVQNVHYKDVLKEARERIEKGAPLSSAFKEGSKYFPVMVGEIIEVGEETGALSQMLLDVARFFEDEVTIATKDLSTIIEPILMVVVGSAVGFFAYSMITPMYSLLGSID